MTMSATAHRGDSRAPSTRNRLIGIDIARFIAVLGMFNIHFGVPFVDGLAEVKAAQFSSGRSTALFTLLAGVSLALLSGRQEPPTGIALRQARWRIAVRAALLVVIGIVLAKATEATGFLLTVIIPFYGMYFLLSLPFVGLRPRGLLVAAGTAAVLGPQLSFVLRSWIERTPAAQGAVDAINSVDPGHLLADAGVLDLLLMDFYPAASYLALVLAGMAIGRMDLRSNRVRWGLGVAGLVVSTATYALSGWLVQLVGGVPDVLIEGTVPVEHPEFLLATISHSGSTFELLGSGGIAVVILAVCLLLADRAGRVLKPLATAGSMALTLYALHAIVMAWQIVVGGWTLSGAPEFLEELASMGPALPDEPDMPAFPQDGHRPEGVVAFVNTYMPELFLVFSVLFAVVWRRFFQRGPLEALVSNTVRRVTEPLFRATAEKADRSR